MLVGIAANSCSSVTVGTKNGAPCGLAHSSTFGRGSSSLKSRAALDRELDAPLLYRYIVARPPARSATAAANRSAPRAQMHTRAPSLTSALALASPRPRLDPVMTATLPSSWRSIEL